MKPRSHLNLLIQGLLVWLLFWLAGLPHYFQQYQMLTMAIGSILLSVLISLVAVWMLLKVPATRRMSKACWISFYYTVPLALLDTWYCGWHLGHGAAYLGRYWYLTIFYLTPWLTFPPTAWLLNSVDHRRAP